MASKRDLKNHVSLLGTVVRSTLLKRALESVCAEPHLNFWRIIDASLMDSAVLAWCMIFGSDAEPTHWKKVVPSCDQESFRMNLLAAMEVEESKWAEYRSELKAYRDTQVAHYREEVKHHPVLNLALKSSYFYYDYLLKRLRQMGETRFPDDLEEYGGRFYDQSVNIASMALASTTQIKERVF